jgi:hypothetical protein
MYDLHNKLNEYYNSELRLKEAERNKLREYKRLNVERVKNGINTINSEENKSYPQPEVVEQGSIAMHTANNHPDNDYDIDVALIFPSDGVSNSALEVRKLVEKAVKKSHGNFSREPEARTNAVTVWYAEGYHVDFAIHRKSEGFWGDKIEHGGAEWTERDPRAITNWFNSSVSSLAPSGLFGVTAEKDQLRKIVRFLKRFSKSRTSWSLPGGLVISALAVECFQSDSPRDDIALYQTIVRINNRLKYNTSVQNPVDSSYDLTYKTQYVNEVKRFNEKLDKAIEKLSVLMDQSCSENQALKVWKWFFNSDFWLPEGSVKIVNEHSTALSQQIQLTASLHNKKHGFQLNSNIKGLLIPKKTWIKFTANTSIAPPFNVKWIVENEGDEAKEKDDLTHENKEYVATNGLITHWESTAYKGNHKLICLIEKNGIDVAKTEFVVRVKK